MANLYDRYGREVERRFFDADDRLVVHPDSGRAIARFVRDGAGRILEERSLDTAEQPINRRDTGWFRRVYTYSPEGRETSSRCFAVNGREILPCKAD